MSPDEYRNVAKFIIDNGHLSLPISSETHSDNKLNMFNILSHVYESFQIDYPSIHRNPILNIPALKNRDDCRLLSYKFRTWFYINSLFPGIYPAVSIDFVINDDFKTVLYSKLRPIFGDVDMKPGLRFRDVCSSTYSIIPITWAIKTTTRSDNVWLGAHSLTMIVDGVDIRFIDPNGTVNNKTGDIVLELIRPYIDNIVNYNSTGMSVDGINLVHERKEWRYDIIKGETSVEQIDKLPRSNPYVIGGYIPTNNVNICDVGSTTAAMCASWTLISPVLCLMNTHITTNWIKLIGIISYMNVAERTSIVKHFFEKVDQFISSSSLYPLLEILFIFRDNDCQNLVYNSNIGVERDTMNRGRRTYKKFVSEWDQHASVFGIYNLGYYVEWIRKHQNEIEQYFLKGKSDATDILKRFMDDGENFRTSILKKFDDRDDRKIGNSYVYVELQTPINEPMKTACITAIRNELIADRIFSVEFEKIEGRYVIFNVIYKPLRGCSPKCNTSFDTIIERKLLHFEIRERSS